MILLTPLLQMDFGWYSFDAILDGDILQEEQFSMCC
jgi:hypothetical protein